MWMALRRPSQMKRPIDELTGDERRALLDLGGGRFDLPALS
jgi:hypothetical protein